MTESKYLNLSTKMSAPLDYAKPCLLVGGEGPCLLAEEKDSIGGVWAHLLACSPHSHAKSFLTAKETVYLDKHAHSKLVLAVGIHTFFQSILIA